MFKWFAFSLLIAGVCPATTIVDSGAGLAASVAAFATNLTSSVAPAPIINLNSPLQNYSVAQTATDTGTGSVNVSLATGAGNAGLHGFASADSPTNSQAYAAFDLYSYDQFNITGSGAETFTYTITLRGNASLAGDPATDLNSSQSYGGLSLYANSSYQTWGTITGNSACSTYYYADSGCGGLIGTIPINAKSNTAGSTLSGNITLEGGSSIELGLYLYSRTYTYNFFFEDPGSSDIDGTFDASDTGFFTLTPDTPGAGFTTASGLTYAADPDAAGLMAPEPAQGLLLVSGLLAIAALTKRRASHVVPTKAV